MKSLQLFLCGIQLFTRGYCTTNQAAARSLHGLGKTFPGVATPFGMETIFE